MFELMDAHSQSAVIKVIGVGGGGGNAVSHMVETGIEGVDFICANTDAQALKNAQVRTGLQIGCNITKGLGAGANPETGRQAAMEDRDRIHEVIEGADMLFITAGLGGGTGTGAAPVIAQLAKELGILTVAVVTRPFDMEGNKRMRVADQGIAELAIVDRATHLFEEPGALEEVATLTRNWFVEYLQGNFPEAEQYYAEAISLPLFPTMADDSQNRVVDTLCAVLEQ